jgi:hypothetical protein
MNQLDKCSKMNKWHIKINIFTDTKLIYEQMYRQKDEFKDRCTKRN